MKYEVNIDQIFPEGKYWLSPRGETNMRPAGDKKE
jgi:hypothetical protein